MVLGSYSSHRPAASRDQNTTQSTMSYVKPKGQLQTEIFLQITFSSQMTKKVAFLHTIRKCKGWLFSLRCFSSDAYVPLRCLSNGTDKNSILLLQQAQDD